jgi:endonuclease/exonuclease/phosphatase (EEP) superfamily protein YafD
VSFTPYVAAACLIPLLLAVVLRAWPVALAAALVAVGLAAAVVPRALPDGNPVAGGPVLRVMAVNLLHSSVPAVDLVNAVRRERPDVLHLLEFTFRMMERVEEAGLGELLPYKVVEPGPDAQGVAIYSRHPLRPSDLSIEAPVFSRSPRHLPVVLTLPDGRDVDLVAVHACAPSAGWRTRCWASSVRALPPAGGRLRVLAGDFNSTMDHEVLRDLIATGYRDAADVTGKGLAMTWPYHAQPRFLPKVAIDHLLADSRIAVLDFRTVPLPLTDHRATLTRLALPAP